MEEYDLGREEDVPSIIINVRVIGVAIRPVWIISPRASFISTVGSLDLFVPTRLVSEDLKHP